MTDMTVEIGEWLRTAIVKHVQTASTEELEQRIEDRPIRPVRIGNALVKEARQELQRRKDSA